MNSLNERMQRYYEKPAKHLLTRRTPVIIRVDGRAFHTFTKNFRKPFDQRMIDAMIVSATTVASNMQGFKLAYIQSDEASFVLTDYDTLQTDAWFGYVKAKVESISASIMTAAFARCMRLANITELTFFDARAFNIPKDDVTNYFLGRAKDWHRNSVSMFTQAFYSHAELKGRCIPEMHEMLHEVGHNWSTDLSNEEKNGTFLVGSDCISLSDVEPHYKYIESLWESVKPCETTKTIFRATGKKQTRNGNTSELNTTPVGSKKGLPGNGT